MRKLAVVSVLPKTHIQSYLLLKHDMAQHDEDDRLEPMLITEVFVESVGDLDIAYQAGKVRLVWKQCWLTLQHCKQPKFSRQVFDPRGCIPSPDDDLQLFSQRRRHGWLLEATFMTPKLEYNYTMPIHVQVVALMSMSMEYPRIWETSKAFFDTWLSSLSFNRCLNMCC